MRCSKAVARPLFASSCDPPPYFFLYFPPFICVFLVTAMSWTLSLLSFLSRLNLVRIMIVSAVFVCPLPPPLPHRHHSPRYLFLLYVSSNHIVFTRHAALLLSSTDIIISQLPNHVQ